MIQFSLEDSPVVCRLMKFGEVFDSDDYIDPACARGTGHQPQKTDIYRAHARRTVEPVRLLRYCQVRAQI